MHIDSPTLLLNTKQCKLNIAQQVKKAKAENVSFRPHFKTHQSHEIGRWYRDLGVDKITVSSLKMAEYFAEDGWKDITVAFPVNIREINRINQLAENIQLNLLVSDPASIPPLLEGLKHAVHIYLEIDTGQKRSGYTLNDLPAIENLLPTLLNHSLIHFDGFLTHSGHSYNHKGTTAELQRIHEQIIHELQVLRAIPVLHNREILISIGDTPIFSRCHNFKQVDEVRPGNAVFYDLFQHDIGACTRDQIAVSMVCPVVALYPERNEAILYGGAIHFSKDGLTNFGELHAIDGKPLPSSSRIFIKSLSQEHGIVHIPDDLFSSISVGTLLYFFPIHSCLTVNLMGHYRTEEGEIIEKFKYS